MKLLKTDDGWYVLEVASAVGAVYSGDKAKIRRHMMIQGVENSEIDLGFDQLRENRHNVAYYGWGVIHPGGPKFMYTIDSRND